MKFQELIDILEKEITIEKDQIIYSRECIKLKEEQINKLKNITIPKPWRLINDNKNDQEKVGIYNEVTEIIDDELSIYGCGIKDVDAECLIKYSEISERILKKRELENVPEIKTNQIRKRMIEVKK